MSAHQVNRAVMIAFNNNFAIAGILRADCDVVESFHLCSMNADGLFRTFQVFDDVISAVNDFNIFSNNIALTDFGF